MIHIVRNVPTDCVAGSVLPVATDELWEIVPFHDRSELV